MLIDDYLPEAEFDIVRMEMIDADPATAMAAVRSANLLRSRFGRVMSSARELPNRVTGWVRGEPVDPKPTFISFGDMTESDEWKLLAESPQEFVAGAIGRFWQRDYGWADFEPAEFAAFEAPDHAKTIIGLKAVAYGPDRTLLVYESRTSTTDETAYRHFRRYWRLLRPFVGRLMDGALDAIRHEAEDMRMEAEIIDLRDEEFVPTR